jgi:O-antigen biosynthesis protein
LATQVTNVKPSEYTERAAADLATIRQELAGVIERCQRDLAAARDENLTVRRELELVNSSSGRRLVLAFRDSIRSLHGAARHPWLTATRLGRKLSRRLGMDPVQTAYDRYCVRRTLLRPLPFHTSETNQANAEEAIRWMGPVEIDGQPRQALFCHPHSSVTYRVTVPGPVAVLAWAGVVPEIWNRNSGGIEFTLRVVHEGTGRALSHSVTLRPKRRVRDRRWRRLIVRLPEVFSGAVLITLSTRLPEGAPPDFAWAIWGEPSVRSARNWGELWHLLVGAFRVYGLTGMWHRLKQAGDADDASTMYQEWLGRQISTPERLESIRDEVSRLPYQPLISVITPVYNTDPQWLRACIESVRGQVYSNWQLSLCDDGSRSAATRQVLAGYETDPRIQVTYLPSNLKISAASNAALAAARGEFVAFLDHDDELAPDGWEEFARRRNGNPDADMIYSDEDKLDLTGQRCDPYFKPDWSPEHFLCTMYTCHLMVLRKRLVDEVGGFRLGYEGAQDYDLVLRVVERTSKIHHIPRVLYHWRKIPESTAHSGSAKMWALDAARRSLEDHVRRNALQAEVLPGGAHGLFRIRYAIRGTPLVSILIPTDGRARVMGSQHVDLLRQCVDSIVRRTQYPNYEIVIIDNGRLSDGTTRFLQSIKHRRVSYSYKEPFNFAHKLNFAAAHACGDHLVIFNDDLEAITPEWLTSMLEYSQQDAIGAVGAKLLYPDGRLQHIGMVIGVCGVSAHAFHGHPGSCMGYASSALSIRNYSAVTGACMMTRRKVFEQVGGFDERFAIDFNDTDYCLRLRRAGYRIVFTPYAQLYHHESGTIGPRAQNRKAMEQMRNTWGDLVDRDPYYNPNLTKDSPNYGLSQ